MKLILITLVAVVVGLVALACTATPTATPTPKYPTIPKNVAIGLVKEHLGMKPLKNLSCFAWMEHENPGAPFGATKNSDGTWEVVWTVKDMGDESRSQIYRWQVYPDSMSVVRIDNTANWYMGCP